MPTTTLAKVAAAVGAIEEKLGIGASTPENGTSLHCDEDGSSVWRPAVAYVRITALTYTREPGVCFIECDSAAGDQAIDLGNPGGMPVEVKKTGEDFNDVVFDYGDDSLTLNVPGQFAKFVPNEARDGWVLWSQVI